jgi:Mn-dependent DtxR family transcriptional regulator
MITKNVEDYLEVIYRLENETKYVRVSDIAKKLDIRPSSVTEMIQKLQQEDFVTHELYGPVNLTEKGILRAKHVNTRHNILKTFLRLLGVKESIADTDACEIEHVIHPETITRLASWCNFIQQIPQGKVCISSFKSFHEKQIDSSEEFKAEDTTA